MSILTHTHTHAGSIWRHLGEQEACDQSCILPIGFHFDVGSFGLRLDPLRVLQQDRPGWMWYLCSYRIRRCSVGHVSKLCTFILNESPTFSGKKKWLCSMELWKIINECCDENSNEVSHAMTFTITRSQPNWTPVGGSGGQTCCVMTAILQVCHTVRDVFDKSLLLICEQCEGMRYLRLCNSCQ